MGARRGRAPPPAPPRPPAAAAGPSPRLTLGSSCSHVALGTGGGAGPGPGSCELEPAAVAARGGERGRRRRRSGLMDARRASAHPAGEVRPGQGAGFHGGPRRAALPAGRVTVCALCWGGGQCWTEWGGEPAHLRTGSARCALRGDPKGPTRSARSRVSATWTGDTRVNKRGVWGLGDLLPSRGARGLWRRPGYTSSPYAAPWEPGLEFLLGGGWGKGSPQGFQSFCHRPAFGHQHGEFML